MVTKIVFATKNKGKIKEIKEILKDLPVEVLSMEEVNLDIDIVEDGKTFEENALIKARQVMRYTNTIVMADDSGLEVDYLNKAPGIYSARYGGPNATDTDKNFMILKELQDVPEAKRTARFVCAIATVFPDNKEYVVRETIEGRIGYEITGENGFGYDPIFYLPEYNQTTAEIAPDLKNKISHRGKALKKMKEILKNKL